LSLAKVNFRITLQLAPLPCGCKTGEYHNGGKRTNKKNQTQSEYKHMYSLTFRVRLYAVNARHVHRLPIRAALCCHSNENRAPIANPPNSTQLGDTPTISPRYIRVRAVVWAYGRGQTDRQMRVTTIHFASSTTQAKCSKCSAVAEMGDCLTTIDMSRKVEGCCAPFGGQKKVGSRSNCRVQTLTRHCYYSLPNNYFRG